MTGANSKAITDKEEGFLKNRLSSFIPEMGMVPQKHKIHKYVSS
jgi:hypothetical protein